MEGKNKLNIMPILKENLRHVVAKLVYPKNIRAKTKDAGNPRQNCLLDDLEHLLNHDHDFIRVVKLGLRKMITEESLRADWQAQVAQSQKEIAIAGTYTRALSRSLESLVVTAFTNWMGKADVNANVELYRSIGSTLIPNDQRKVI